MRSTSTSAGSARSSNPTDAWISSGFDVRLRGANDARTHRLCARLRLDAALDLRELRFAEATLALGERIAVFGAGVREPDPDTETTGERGYRTSQPTRFRFAGTERFPLMIRNDISSL